MYRLKHLTNPRRGLTVGGLLLAIIGLVVVGVIVWNLMSSGENEDSNDQSPPPTQQKTDELPAEKAPVTPAESSEQSAKSETPVRSDGPNPLGESNPDEPSREESE